MRHRSFKCSDIPAPAAYASILVRWLAGLHTSPRSLIGGWAGEPSTSVQLGKWLDARRHALAPATGCHGFCSEVPADVVSLHVCLNPPSWPPCTCSSDNIILTDQGIVSSVFWAQVGGKVGYVETGLLLDIAPNRPDLDAVIAAGIQEASTLGAAEVALYVGGADRTSAQPFAGGQRQSQPNLLRSHLCWKVVRMEP